jgi:ascorbate-specific PTS system EIIC-type component UlaA
MHKTPKIVVLVGFVIVVVGFILLQYGAGIMGSETRPES